MFPVSCFGRAIVSMNPIRLPKYLGMDGYHLNVLQLFRKHLIQAIIRYRLDQMVPSRRL